ncbi:hypothetical protein ABH15_03825 [Methanoculleus taiwanensis]|uniref:Uncharacterized protein n=1 Tax=Methanoculleus taiwanensis TaxID=1550565 RepID=A0A498H3H3_9EURY|nr:hypothetical protein [Methanoculleus taiwanensis]RXE57472.1 hypothetical protein ABH15_03825 [Methanoculleus taiwanensis]
MKNTQKNGSKKDEKNWYKLVFVGVAVMFAAAMVLTYLTPIFTAPRTVQPGDTAVIAYTIRDAAGQPVLTTDQQLVQSEYEKGNIVVLTGGMEIPAGIAVSGENVAPVPIYYPQMSEFAGFGLLGFETNAISAGLVGMRPGEVKSVRFDYGGNDLRMNFSIEAAEGFGLDFKNATVGDKFTIGLTATPEFSLEENSTVTAALRIGEIVEKTPDQLVIQYRYGSADILLQQIA